MMTNSEPTVCVCILAHNEERNISKTLAAIYSTSTMESISIYVYANGCTDRTVEEVTTFSHTHKNVHLRELPIASKPGAWNTAFFERTTDYIIFSDGDVTVETGAVMQLVKELIAYPNAVIATCRQVTKMEGITFQQNLVGFMQLPLVQNFLAGGFYAVKRKSLEDLLEQKGFVGIPSGVAGEDAFLDYIVGTDRLIVSEFYSAYIPPDLSDYCRYLARIRWQNEQIRQCWKDIATNYGSLKRFIDKMKRIRSGRRVFVACFAVSARYLYKLIFSSQIEKEYRNIGNVRIDGAEVLRDSTRSQSTK